MNRMREEDQKAGEARLYGIVLLSDGKDTRSQRTLNEMLDCLPTGNEVEGVKIYPIAYGDAADKTLLTRIANRTNGRFYVATPENIKQIYLQISAEQ
jgi:Ca-activated chloride channel family protein